MSILVIEDDASIRETLGFILEADGFETMLMESGEDALAYLASCPSRDWPQILMLDLTLPGLSGDEVFFEIGRRFNRIPPTILMTAAISGHEKVKYLNGSVFLPKPFTLEQLSETLEKVLENNSRPAAGLTCQIGSSQPMYSPSEAAWT